MTALSRSPSSADPVQLGRLIAAGRVAIGIALVAAPGLFPRLVAGTGSRQDVLALARIAGARDLGMGVGTLLAARHGATPELRRWMAASAFADGVDALAIARSSTFLGLPRLASVAAGTSAAVLGAVVCRQLPAD
jgi:hypothetical protein